MHEKVGVFFPLENKESVVRSRAPVKREKKTNKVGWNE